MNNLAPGRHPDSAQPRTDGGRGRGIGLSAFRRAGSVGPTTWWARPCFCVRTPAPTSTASIFTSMGAAPSPRIDAARQQGSHGRRSRHSPFRHRGRRPSGKSPGRWFPQTPLSACRAPTIRSSWTTSCDRWVAIFRWCARRSSPSRRSPAGTFADRGQDAREALINEWYPGGGGPARRSRTGDRRRLLSRRSRPAGAGARGARAFSRRVTCSSRGDWSLLDVVRQRPKLWRDDRVLPTGER